MARKRKKKIAAKGQLSKYIFDQYEISKNWKMQVRPSLCSCSKTDYELWFVFDGVRYGYKKTFSDPTYAFTVGQQYLDYRYKNKGLYV